MMKKITSISIVIISLSISTHADESFQSFDVIDAGKDVQSAPHVEPWKTIKLEPEYGGLWLVAGDLNGDGEAEIVTSENFNENDVHYTTTAVAQKLDGTVLWKWGQPSIGRKIWHHDVACQIHDWDGDGNNEVIVATKGFIVELNGQTGVEIRRIPIEDDASDCLVFCDLSGVGRPTDVLVKNRYHQIWAYSEGGDLLWTVKDPGGYRTAHQPRPIDVDHDGRDEIMAGYAMLNADGSVRWTFQSKSVDQGRGHLDCMRVVKQSNNPEDARLALTCCGAENLAVVNGNGDVIWEQSGHHFESINIGEFDPSNPGNEILVDIDHRPLGDSPLWILNAEGAPIGQIVTDYSRHHKLLDWTGDGVDEIFVGHNRAVYNQQGEKIFTLEVPQLDADAEQGEASLILGDMTGDGVLDAIIIQPGSVSIFKNEHGKQPSPPASLGTGVNVSLY